MHYEKCWSSLVLLMKIYYDGFVWKNNNSVLLSCWSVKRYLLQLGFRISVFVSSGKFKISFIQYEELALLANILYLKMLLLIQFSYKLSLIIFSLNFYSDILVVHFLLWFFLRIVLGEKNKKQKNWSARSPYFIVTSTWILLKNFATTKVLSKLLKILLKSKREI